MSHQNSALLKFKWPCTYLVEKKTVTVKSVEAALRECLSLHSRNVGCESLEACNEYISVDDKFRGSWSVNLIFQDGNVSSRSEKRVRSTLNSLQATAEGFHQNKVKVRVVCGHKHKCYCSET